MNAKFGLITSAGCLALAACAQPESPEEAANAIMALESQWSAKAGEKDIDWIADLHWADARQMPSGVPAIVGADAIKAAWQDMLVAQGLELSWTSEFAKASGDLAYDYGRGVIRTPDGATIPAKYLVVWERRDGEWKVAVDMFSPDQ